MRSSRTPAFPHAAGVRVPPHGAAPVRGSGARQVAAVATTRGAAPVRVPWIYSTAQAWTRSPPSRAAQSAPLAWVDPSTCPPAAAALLVEYQCDTWWDALADARRASAGRSSSASSGSTCTTAPCFTAGRGVRAGRGCGRLAMACFPPWGPPTKASGETAMIQDVVFPVERLSVVALLDLRAPVRRPRLRRRYRDRPRQGRQLPLRSESRRSTRTPRRPATPSASSASWSIRS